MKFVSFNINGLRARLHQLTAIIEQLQPDVLGLQETKVHDDMFPCDELAKLGYHFYYYGQKGHYGVALLSKQAPLAVQYGFADDTIDSQRRIIMADFASPDGPIRVINGYFPQGENRDHPLKFPAKALFYAKLHAYIKEYFTENHHLLLMGDLNISPTDLDIGIGEENKKRWLRTGKCSFLPEERQWLNQLQALGLTDLFRQQHPSVTDRFSWFDYRSAGFNDNRGLRIDLLLASPTLAERCQASEIDYTIRAMEKPSDHAPVWAQIDY